MCRIAGIFNLNGEPVSPVILRKMTDAIAHRGPDDEGKNRHRGQAVLEEVRTRLGLAGPVTSGWVMAMSSKGRNFSGYSG